MSIPNLPVDFKDDILASSNTKRKYRQTTNGDSTVSFEDVTNYSQEGSEFGAKEVNQTNTAINNIYDERVLDVDALELITEPGFFVDAQVVKELNGKILYPKVFSNTENSEITITAPFDGWCEVTMSLLGWGYGGNLWSWVPNTDSSNGLVLEGDLIGACEGSDGVHREMIGKAYFSNMKKGHKYTFTRRDAQGSSGRFANQRINVVCYPE